MVAVISISLVSNTYEPECMMHLLAMKGRSHKLVLAKAGNFSGMTRILLGSSRVLHVRVLALLLCWLAFSCTGSSRIAKLVARYVLRFHSNFVLLR